MGYGKLFQSIVPLSSTSKVLETRGFSKWPWEGFGFEFEKVLKYPKIHITECCIKRRIYCVCSS